MICKGSACTRHLEPELKEGVQAFKNGDLYDNSYDFFDDYLKRYSWDIGYQKGKSEVRYDL